MINMEIFNAIALLCIVALILTAGGLVIARRYLPRQFLAVVKSQRSNHFGSPRQLGGLVISPVFLLCLTLISSFLGLPDFQFYLITSGLVLLFVIGLIDDWKGLGIVIRLPCQFIAAFLLLTASGVFTEVNFLIYGLVLVALVYWINVVNFMDGLDLLSVVGLSIPMLTMGVILINAPNDGVYFGVIGFLAAACLAGFAFHNFPAALVFLGDSGSLFLGGASGVCALMIAFTISPFLALLPISYYVVDASSTIVLRLFNRENIFKAHSYHAYQRAFRSGKSALSVSLYVALLNILLGCLTLFASELPYPSQFACLMAGMLLVSMVIFLFRKSKLS